MGDKWKTAGLKNHQEVFKEKKVEKTEVVYPEFKFNTERLKDTGFKQYVSNPDAKPYSFLDFKVSKYNEYVELGCFLGIRPENATLSNGEKLLDVMYKSKADWGNQIVELNGSSFDNVLIRYDQGTGKSATDISICKRDVFYQTYNVDKETGLCQKMGSVFALECPQEKFDITLLDGRKLENVSNCSKEFIEKLKQAIGEENVKVYETVGGKSAVEIFTLESNRDGEFLSPSKTITIGLIGEAWLQETEKFNGKYTEVNDKMELIAKDFTHKVDEVDKDFEDKFYDEHGFTIDDYFEAGGNEEKALELHNNNADNFSDNPE